MADSPQRRYSASPPRRSKHQLRSPSPVRGRSGSRSRSVSRSPSRRVGATNPGNNLYVTGLSTRITERDLEDYFSREGKVLECRLVVDARSKASRGFAFVTMDTVENAERCIKYLNHSILDGRVVTVEKARRKRPRTPTPGRYLGIRNSRDSVYGDRSRRRGSYESSRDAYRSRRSPRYSSHYRRDFSPDYSPYRSRRYGRDRSISPGYSPYHSPRRGHSRSRSASRSPYSR